LRRPAQDPLGFADIQRAPEQLAGRAGANSISGFCFITLPTSSASSSTLVCREVAMLNAGASKAPSAEIGALVASTLARATSFTKT
jgi:hypothetical protein